MMNKIIYGSYYELLMKTMWSNVFTLKFINSCFDNYCKKYKISIRLSNEYIEPISIINNKIKNCNNERKRINIKLLKIDQVLNSKKSYKTVLRYILIFLIPLYTLALLFLLLSIFSKFEVIKVVFIILLLMLVILFLLLYNYYYQNIYKYEKEKKKLNKEYFQVYKNLNYIYDNDLNNLTTTIYNKEIEPLIKK